MKKLRFLSVIVLLSICSSLFGQVIQPTTGKTRFMNGIYFGCRDSSYYVNGADTVVLYFNCSGADSGLYVKQKGKHKRIAFNSDIADSAVLFVRYTDTADMLSGYNLQRVTNLGSTTSNSITAPYFIGNVKSQSSAGGAILNNSGSTVAEFGAGGGTNFDFHGFAGYNANRSSSYTDRSFTDKGYVDSLATNGFVRLQTGAVSAQTGKVYITDTLRTNSVVWGSKVIASTFGNTGGAIGVLGQWRFSNNEGIYTINVAGNTFSRALYQDNSDTIRIGNTTTPTILNGIGFANGANRIALPNASGTLALTSDIPVSGTFTNRRIPFSNNSGQLKDTSMLTWQGGGLLVGTATPFSSAKKLTTTDIGLYGVNTGLYWSATNNGTVTETAISTKIENYTTGLGWNQGIKIYTNTAQGDPTPALRVTIPGVDGAGGYPGVTIDSLNVTTGVRSPTFYGSLVGATANLTGSVNVNGATADANAAMSIKASSGTGSYLMFGRNSADVLVYSLKNDGSANFNGLVTASGGISSTTGSFIGAVTASSFVKTGGTSSQFLKADGSVDGTSYATAASLSGYLPLSGGTLTGALSGTSASFSGNMNASNYNLAAWKIIDWSGVVARLGGINASQWTQVELYTGGSVRYTIDPSGNNTWTGGGSFGGALSGTSASFTANSTTVALNTSTRAIDVTGKNNFYAVSITGGATTGQSFGQVISAGTNSNDISLAVYNKAETVPYFFVRGDGNIGIGTTSPTAVVNSNNTVLNIYQNSASYGAELSLSGQNANLHLGNGSAATYIYSTGAYPMTFFTNGSERMRLTSGGALLLNTTTDDGSNKLQVAGSGLFTGDVRSNGIYRDYQGEALIQTSGSNTIIGSSGAGTARSVSVFAGNAERLTIATTGAATFASSVTATAFYESSDLRQKTVHTTAKSADGIDAIQYTFNPNKTEKWGYGAQQVQKVLPYAVSTGSDGFLKVDYTTVHTYKIAQLEKRIAELEKLLQK